MVGVMGSTSKGTFGIAAVAVVLVTLCFVANPAGAQTPTPTFGGDCCSEHPGRGCEDNACTTCVCDLDSPCCGALGWDRFCVSSANDPLRCADACPCVAPTPTPGGDCCEVHDGTSCDVTACAACVCGADPFCCNTEWDSTCVVRAGDECGASCPCAPPPTPTPTPIPTPGGDCCTAHAGPECNDSRCQACVCEIDSECCEGVWDERCVDEANVECAADCTCDAAGDCCADHEGVGCSDMRCQDCVCGIDEQCCDERWDGRCADEAFNECAIDCTCEAAGDCCAPNLGLGCDVQSCQDCVCGIDSDCCTNEWDERCVDEANVECAASCFCDMADCCSPHDTLGCDELSCQTCVCSIDSTCCTEVWDEQCSLEAAEECGTRCSCGSLSDCCLGREEPGCEVSTCESCVCGVDSSCCDDIWDGTCTDIASNPDECGSSCPCGGEATPTPTPIPTPGGDCCSPHAGRECDDSACQACVCDIDPNCCTGAWDERCVDEASNPDDCAESCTCVSDCCFEREEGACDDQICEDCVCEADSFCCSSLWDSGCVELANLPDVCGFSCTCLPYCPGDCGFDGLVSIVDLIDSVNILLGNSSLDFCPTLDTSRDGTVTVDEVVQALNAALEDCFR